MNYLFYILKFSGIPFLIREFIQRKNVTILVYHDISVDNARVHFTYLKQKYNIISLQDFIQTYKKNKVKDLPKKSLIITLDDGYKGNYALLPLIKELNIPITISICSHIIGTNRHYWFKHKVKGVSIEELKKMANKDRLDVLKKVGFEQESAFEDRMGLSYTEIEEMSEYVDFQSHSMYHPCLPYCTKEESDFEIANSKVFLEQLFKFKINTFSFPNGDYSNREIESLKEHGYDAGITCDLWFNNQKTNIYKLKRFDCRDEASLVELEVKVTGIYIFLKRLFYGKNFGYTGTE